MNWKGSIGKYPLNQTILSEKTNQLSDHIQKPGQPPLRPQHMVVNTEWGAFGDNGELDYVKTKWDEEVKLHISFKHLNIELGHFS